MSGIIIRLKTKEKLKELLGRDYVKTISEKADIDRQLIYKWFNMESYVNVKIERTCRTLIEERLAELSQLEELVD